MSLCTTVLGIHITQVHRHTCTDRKMDEVHVQVVHLYTFSLSSPLPRDSSHYCHAAMRAGMTLTSLHVCSFTRLWGPLLHERIARPRFLRNQREIRDATFAGHAARAHAGLLPPAVALLPLPPRCCATSSSASTPSCATSAAVSPAERRGQTPKHSETALQDKKCNNGGRWS